VSYIVSVYCGRAVETLTRQQIGEWIEEGIYFDHTPEFDPPLNSAEAGAPEWDRLVIRYAAAKRPVVLVRSRATTGIEEKEEIEEEIDEDFVLPPLDSVLKNRIVEARQVFILDVNPESLTEEAWDMCDSIERFIASRCDGLIWAGGDGLFDANLQRVATAKRRRQGDDAD
jgi:hypothetical protein